MKMKTYEGFDIRKILDQIKADFGSEAVIFSNENIMKRPEGSSIARRAYRVTAGADMEPMVSTNPRNQKDYNINIRNKKDSIGFQEIIDAFNAIGIDKFSELLGDIQTIRNEIKEIKSNIHKDNHSDFNSPLDVIYDDLTESGVDMSLANKVLKKIEPRAQSLTFHQIRNLITRFIEELLPVNKDIFDMNDKLVLSLIGPTGVGKTTTLAKIAAKLKLDLNRKVCIMTIDNFRIGAVNQLSSFATIIESPLINLDHHNKVRPAVYEALNSYDCVLIDSLGTSQHDQKQIEMLKKYYSQCPEIEKAAVISMSSNHKEMMSTFSMYEQLSPDYLIFTKLDETSYHGTMLNIPVLKKIPLILLTDGQVVPDDMETPTGKTLAKRIMSGVRGSIHK